MQGTREHWGSRLGFVMAAAGSAIGLGTLWKFPYTAGEQGGGWFVLIYLSFLFLLGFPIFVAELVLGRASQKGAVGTFAKLAPTSPAWKSLGWLFVVTSIIMLSYYSLVSGWSLNYMFMSLSQFYQGRSDPQISHAFQDLYASADISLFWQGIVMLLVAALLYRGVRQGIEYWTKMMTSALFVIFIALVLYNVTLEGFGEAVRFAFTPHTGELKASGLLEAVGLAFFNLSVGQGILVTYGSYLRPGDNLPKTAFIVTTMVLGISVGAALVVFPALFTFGYEPAGGFGLVFQVLPVLFTKLPGTMMVATTFFALLSFAALTSAVGQMEVVVANFIDMFQWSRRRAVAVSALIIFILGIPSAFSGAAILFPEWSSIYGRSFFETMSFLVSDWLLPIGGLLTAIFVGWKLDRNLCRAEFGAHSLFARFFGVWLWVVRWVVPAAIVIIVLQNAQIIKLDQLFS